MQEEVHVVGRPLAEFGDERVLLFLLDGLAAIFAEGEPALLQLELL